MMPLMWFSQRFSEKRKVKDPKLDMIISSATTYGNGVTQKMVNDYYKAKLIR